MRCHAIAGARLQYRASTSASKSLAHKGDLAWQRSVMPLINSCRKNVSPASCVHATHEATCLRHLLQLKEQGAAVVPPDLAPEKNSQPRSDSVVASMFRTKKNIRADTVDFQVAGTFYKDNRRWGSPHYAFHQEVRPLLPRVQVHHRDPPTQGKALRRPVGNGRRKLLPPGHGSFRRGGAVRRRRGDPAVRRDRRAGRCPRRSASMALGGWRRGLQNVGVG